MLKYVVFITLLLITSVCNAESLIAYWDFDNIVNDTIIDKSGNNNQIFPANALNLPQALNEGQYGKALYFGKNSNYAAVIINPESPLQKLPQTFTVSFWFKSFTYNQKGIMLTYNQSGIGWTVGLNPDGTLTANLVTADKEAGLAVGLFDYKMNQFIHVAVIFDVRQGPREIYLNGQLQQARSQKSWGLGNTNGFLLGCRKKGTTTPSEKFQGAIDELCIFNGIMSQNKILEIAGESKSLSRSLALKPAKTSAESVFWSKVYTAEELDRVLLENTEVSGIRIDRHRLPKGLKVDQEAGLLVNESMTVRKLHAWPPPMHKLDAVCGFLAPNGDWLVMFSAGRNQCGSKSPRDWFVKTQNMLIYRSTDKGKTWQGPKIAWPCDYTSSFVIPFIPKGSNRIYAFGNELVPTLRKNKEDSPIAFRYSDDNGHTWSKPNLIRPQNDPDYVGISAMDMCETDKGTWLLGSHDGDWTITTKGPLRTRQYILRSEDKGNTWTLLPDAAFNGWYLEKFNRMEEGRVIDIPGGAYLLCRTAEGHLWNLRSYDDGLTWSEPAPTSLVHPDAPSMLFRLSDNKTLIALIHNRYTPEKPHFNQADRMELWFSLSRDHGRTWSDPKFLFANFVDQVRRHNVSYTDMFIDDGLVNFVIPHLWEEVIIVSMKESDLHNLPSKEKLMKMVKK